VVEGAINVACSGAEPIGFTNCLNFASPEQPAGYWQLTEAVAGMAEACRRLGVPIVSGNVSLYNETPDGPILPTPVVGTVGLLRDRARAIPMRWSRGDAIWLLGAAAWDAAAISASELAWRRGRFGGKPLLDLEAAVRLVQLLGRLAADGLVAGAHDASVGGLGVALARLAIASSSGAAISFPREATQFPTASLFGERAGRVLVAVPPAAEARLSEAAGVAEVAASRLGTAGGDRLEIVVGEGHLGVSLDQLAAAWSSPF
jgi:phosphoribosylformylglycinamidine synthase